MQADNAARGHRTLLSVGPLYVFADDGYSPGERVLFVAFRLPRLNREAPIKDDSADTDNARERTTW